MCESTCEGWRRLSGRNTSSFLKSGFSSFENYEKQINSQIITSGAYRTFMLAEQAKLEIQVKQDDLSRQMTLSCTTTAKQKQTKHTVQKKK